jgi:hypothetical protein
MSISDASEKASGTLLHPALPIAAFWFRQDEQEKQDFCVYWYIFFVFLRFFLSSSC